MTQSQQDELTTTEEDHENAWRKKAASGIPHLRTNEVFDREDPRLFLDTD